MHGKRDCWSWISPRVSSSRCETFFGNDIAQLHPAESHLWSGPHVIGVRMRLYKSQHCLPEREGRTILKEAWSCTATWPGHARTHFGSDRGAVWGSSRYTSGQYRVQFGAVFESA
eukprot:2914678-Rhodomonas_salina.4